MEGWPSAQSQECGLRECDVLQCDGGLGVSPCFLFCVIWPGVHLSMKVLEAEVCLAHGNAAGPADSGLPSPYYVFLQLGERVTYIESLLHALFLKRYFSDCKTSAHLYHHKNTK